MIHRQRFIAISGPYRFVRMSDSILMTDGEAIPHFAKR